MTKHVTNETFREEVLSTKGVPILVKFEASWCAPCKAMAPVLEELSGELGIDVANADVEECDSFATAYALRQVPTLMIFSGGKVVATRAGAGSKSQIRSWISSSLAA